MKHIYCEKLKATVSVVSCERGRKEPRQYQQCAAHCRNCKGWEALGFKEVENFAERVAEENTGKKSAQTSNIGCYSFDHSFEKRK